MLHVQHGVKIYQRKVVGKGFSGHHFHLETLQDEDMYNAVPFVLVTHGS